MSDKATSGASPFSPRAVLTLLLFGTLAFVAALYFIGAGDSGKVGPDGGGHVAGNGLNGYAALAGLLSAQGYDVRNVRSKAQLQGHNLLILTPPQAMDGKEMSEIVTNRRYNGPTVVILPKWGALPANLIPGAKARQGWVVLGPAEVPDWPDFYDDISVKIAPAKGQPAWRGAGLAGKLPDEKNVLSGAGKQLEALVTGADGAILAAYVNDGGIHPKLEEMAGTGEDRLGDDDSLYPLVMVFEPDLMNNYGMADRNRALLALRLLDAAREDEDLPVAFDLTFNGYGTSNNLLTLAFKPPFLAATLCFLIAALIVGWRALKRFGPPIAASPVFAFGKRQLATNGAALIQRSKRLHLLGAPYAAILRGRVAQALGLRQGADTALTESEIDRLLERRGVAPADFSTQAEALRQAKGPHELLRRAHALKQIERKLAR